MRRLNIRATGAVLLAAVALSARPAAADAFPYHVLERIPVSGAAPVQALAFGPRGKRLYAAAGDELLSYDAASGEPGPATKLPGVGVGIAASADDGGVLYVATRGPSRVVTLALRDLRITASVSFRNGEPSALLYDSDADALYVESRAAELIARLDPKSGKTLGVVHLHGRLEQMALNERGTLYVANAAGNTLEAIETARMTRTGAIPLSGCSAPSGLSMDPVGRRLFVACGNEEAQVIDEEMGFPFVRLPIERAASLQSVFAFHPMGSDGWKGGAFIAGDGPALDAIQMKAFISYAGGGSLPLGGRCTALAVSPSARRLVLALVPRVAGTASAESPAAAAGAAGEGMGVELLMLGGTSEGVSR
jgi:hypothetical protein